MHLSSRSISLARLFLKQSRPVHPSSPLSQIDSSPFMQIYHQNYFRRTSPAAAVLLCRALFLYHEAKEWPLYIRNAFQSHWVPFLYVSTTLSYSKGQRGYDTINRGASHSTPPWRLLRHPPTTSRTQRVPKG